LTQTDLNFCFFRRFKSCAHQHRIQSAAAGQQVQLTTNKKHRDRLVRKEGETDARQSHSTPPAAIQHPDVDTLPKPKP
jgi:hypothetical protein